MSLILRYRVNEDFREATRIAVQTMGSCVSIDSTATTEVRRRNPFPLNAESCASAGMRYQFRQKPCSCRCMATTCGEHQRSLTPLRSLFKLPLALSLFSAGTNSSRIGNNEPKELLHQTGVG